MRRIVLLASLIAACGPERVDLPILSPSGDAGPADGGRKPDGGRAGTLPTGSTCESDDDCLFARCETALPGGYCTGPCEPASPATTCGLATVCGDLGLGAGASCEAACSGDLDCRDGYRCRSGGCVGDGSDGGPRDGGRDAGPNNADAGTPDGGRDAGPVDAGPPDAGWCPGLRCGAACVDPLNDNANCGTCGHTCPEYSTCGGGECRNTLTSIGFGGTVTCSGGTRVFMGARPPQQNDSDVICWNPLAGSGPGGDQLWTYDATRQLLVNQVNNLALKIRSNSTIGLGSSATDGTRVTLSEVSGKWQLYLPDHGAYIGLSKGNCPGGLYVKTTNSSSYIVSFDMQGG